MKFEFVEFYPITMQEKKKSGKLCIGTLHIYVIDIQMDIRGIRVNRWKNKIYFHMPTFSSYDQETGEKVRYPIIWFNETSTQKDLLEFLNIFVRPILKGRFNIEED